MATPVEIVCTPGVLRCCVWYRIDCWNCGEYEMCLDPNTPAPTSCHHCQEPIEVSSVVHGHTARLLPEISEPRTRPRAIESETWIAAKQPPPSRRRGGTGRPRKEQHEPASR